MNTQVTNLAKNMFFAIVAVNAVGQQSWLNISGVPLDVTAEDFEQNHFNVEWAQSFPFAFLFNRQPMAELSWDYSEKFFQQINLYPDEAASTTVLLRNHGFVPTQVRLMQYTIAEDGQRFDGVVLRELQVAVKTQKAA